MIYCTCRSNALPWRWGSPAWPSDGDPTHDMGDGGGGGATPAAAAIGSEAASTGPCPSLLLPTTRLSGTLGDAVVDGVDITPAPTDGAQEGSSINRISVSILQKFIWEQG